MAFLNNTGLERLWSKIIAKLDLKVDKVDGKGLSTNDYTTTEKNKLAGIATGANKTTVDSALSTTSTNPVQNKIVTADINSLKSLVGDTAVSTQITNAIASKSDTSHTHSAATTSAAGFMSKDDKTKLDGITASADSVSFSRSLTSGTKVGTITINGTGTDLYAPTNTDTHYTTGLKVGASNTATANAAASNGSVYLNVLDNTTVRDSHKITGSGATTVTSDANGVITINSTNTTYSTATSSANGLMSSSDKSKLDGIATGANKTTVDSALSSSSTNPVQNKVVNTAISNLNTLVGDTAVSTQITNATNNCITGLSVSGRTVTYTKKDGSTGTITTQDTNTTYSAMKGATSSAAGSAGLVPAPSAGAATRYLRSDGTWQVPPDTNTTYSAATQSANGLMSAADKKKLDGIASGANSYTLPTASSSTLGGVKTTSTVTSTSGLTACPIISGVPYYKDTNTTYSLSSFGVTSTAEELNYCDGVTSNIQTQLNKSYNLNILPIIPDGSNLNDYTTPGMWSRSTYSTLYNAPCSAPGKLCVESGHGADNYYITQKFQDFWGNLFYRSGSNYGSGWTRWNHVLSNVLTSNEYGSTLPTAGTAGRIFFKKV